MIQAGDIGFVMHHDNRLSRLIAWFMKSRWSHTFMVCQTGTPRTFLVETSDLEATYGTFNKYADDANVSYEVWSPIAAAPSDREAVVADCEKLVGKVYPFWQLLSLGLRRLLMRVGIRIGNILPFGYACDEAVLFGARKYIGLENIEPHSIDTEELYQLVSASGYFRKVAWN